TSLRIAPTLASTMARKATSATKARAAISAAACPQVNVNSDSESGPCRPNHIETVSFGATKLFQTPADRLLRPAVRWLVVPPALRGAVGEVLLGDPPAGVIVRVEIPLPVPEPLGPRVAGPAQVGGDLACPRP